MTSGSDDPEPSKAARLLDLMAFVATRRFPVTGAQIMAGVPGYRDRWLEGDRKARRSAKRMFERDKADLKELGIPLQTPKAGVTGGDEETRYRLRASSFQLPELGRLRGDADHPGNADPSDGADPRDRPAGISLGEVDLSSRELRIAVEGLQHVLGLPAFPLRRPARLALRKLTFDLAPELEEGSLPVHHLPAATDPHLLDDHLQVAARAVLGRRILRFGYYTIGADREEEREVEPRGLLYQGSRWYLVAWDRDRRDERLFRIDRMRDPVEEGDGPQFDLPEGYSLERFRERAPWELGDDEVTEVRVHFRWPRSLLADRNGWGELVEDRGREGAVRRFSVQAAGPLLRWILSQAGEARIMAPDELARRLAEMRRRTLELHS